MLYEDLMQSVSREFPWLIGGFDAGDGKRGNYLSCNLNRCRMNEDEEDISIYRIDGKKLISLSLS